MLIEIFALGLTIVFVFSFCYVNNYYENSKKISAAKHYAEQALAKQFIEVAQQITRMRHSSMTNLAGLENAMDKQDMLVTKYQDIVAEQIQQQEKDFRISII